MPKPWEFKLTDDFDVSERGCLLWIMGDDATRHWIFWDLKEGRYLRAHINPDNYPGCNVGIVQHESHEAFAKFIMQTFGGWNCRHSNLPGIEGNSSVPEMDEQGNIIQE